ncbi:hypothetical protein ATY79_26980 [Rhizobium sp. R693]|nr:hypothetical protein ATY79_26980 [Rhizobium sp. R693]
MNYPELINALEIGHPGLPPCGQICLGAAERRRWPLRVTRLRKLIPDANRNRHSVPVQKTSEMADTTNLARYNA